MSRFGNALFLTVTLLGAGSVAAQVPSGYRQVAGVSKVPASVLYALALTESGVRLASGKRRPWPWTLNVEGRAHRYPTRQAAWRALHAILARGITRVDIGLMQVNWAYHKDALVDAWRALEPYHNLQVGAAILRTEYRASGDWWRAVGRYHAPNNPARANRYRARVVTWYQRLAGENLPG